MEEKLINIVKEILEIDKCTLETDQKDIESWDSLGHVMLIAEIQDKFNINIPFDSIDKINKVKDFLEYLR